MNNFSAFPDPPPELTVDPAVISAETHTVRLNCQPPPSATVSECHFVIEGGKTIHHFSCQQTLTRSRFLVKSGQSSPAVVKVQCYYTVMKKEVNSPSEHSSTLSIYILGKKKHKLVYLHFSQSFSAECHSE